MTDYRQYKRSSDVSSTLSENQVTAMEGEDVVEEPQTSLYKDFPKIDENSLTCLVARPNGVEYFGPVYEDLYVAMSKEPGTPSRVSDDPFMRLVFNVRSTLSYLTVMLYTGQIDAERQYVKRNFRNVAVKFSKLYPQFAATMIQRCWRASRAGATDEDKSKFQVALGSRPWNARVQDDRQVLAGVFNEVSAAYPFEF